MTDTTNTTAEVGEVDDFDDSNIEGLQYSIRERLAELSEASDAPTDFASNSSVLDVADIRFDNGTWIQAVLDTQGWLRLEDELRDAAADVFIPQLVQRLGGDPEEAIDSAGPALALSATGLTLLDARLEQSLQNQREFLEVYSSGTGTRASATEAWVEAWGDQLADEEEEHVGTIRASTASWPIMTFVNNDLNLTPSYQRGDVWSSGVRQSLIESILRGIPLPSIILLKPDNPKLPFEVVDGKQRLTAILRFVGRHPRATKYVQEIDAKHDQNGLLVDLLKSDYLAFRRKWKQLLHETLTPAVEDKYFFPFKLRNRPAALKGKTGPLDAVWGKYYTQIRDEVVSAGNEDVLVSQLFELSPDYEIPVILYRQTHPRQIHEVFKLYNKQGIHLNAEEIRNAIFHDLELTRALLVAAGDADQAVANVPSLKNITTEVSGLANCLTEYGFGISRYRRTKVLSWVVATLLHDNGEGNLPSTARQIDNLLSRVQRDTADPLRGTGALEDLFRWLYAAVDHHSAAGDELWAPAFRGVGTRGGWQELQLVGSLIGVALVYATHPNTAEEMLDDAAEELHKASATARLGWKKSHWARPEKSQTREQWQCIARIAKAITDIVDVDTEAAGQAIAHKYGFSGVARLLADTGNAVS